jgi:hypothetical protein
MGVRFRNDLKKSEFRHPHCRSLPFSRSLWMKDHVSKGDQIWCLHVGSGQLIATAVHDGHEVRDEVAQHLALT